MVTEGVLFHGEIERPLSPYHRVFVIAQSAGSGVGKEAERCC